MIRVSPQWPFHDILMRVSRKDALYLGVADAQYRVWDLSKFV